jgi:hypothetical protein
MPLRTTIAAHANVTAADGFETTRLAAQTTA